MWGSALKVAPPHAQFYGITITSNALVVHIVQDELHPTQVVHISHECLSVAFCFSPALISNISALLSKSFASNEYFFIAIDFKYTTHLVGRFYSFYTGWSVSIIPELY